MHTTPKAWGWRWARLAVFGLLLAGWECEEDQPYNEEEVPLSNALPIGFLGQTYAYSEILDLGETPYSLSVVNGDSPAWLDVSIDENGRLFFYGTPTFVGDVNMQVRITDAQAEQTLFERRLRVVANQAITLGGQWNLTVDVTEASGVCSGDENDPPSTHVVTLTQVGSDISLSGIQGEPGNVLAGYIYPYGVDDMTIRLDGTVEEDGGVTDMLYNLDILTSTSLRGLETWSWDGPWEDCAGRSELDMTRLP